MVPKRKSDACTLASSGARRARLEAIHEESVYVDPIHASVPIESGSTGLDVRRLTGASDERAEVLAEGVRGTNKQQPNRVEMWMEPRRTWSKSSRGSSHARAGGSHQRYITKTLLCS